MQSLEELESGPFKMHTLMVCLLFRWYSQAGTPKLTVEAKYEAAAQLYTLSFTQVTPPTAGQPAKQAVLIPVSMGLLAPDGREIELKLQARSTSLQQLPRYPTP